MINKGAFSQEDMSTCPIALTTSNPNSPVNDGSRNASSTFNPRTAPNCASCKNHGLKIVLKGHKRYCKYWNCPCVKCLQTSTRRKSMARETAQRRARKLHETKIREYEKARERARMLGERTPTPPMELLSPILSPELQSSSLPPGSELTNVDPGSPDSATVNDSGIYGPVPRNRTSTAGSLGNGSLLDEPSTSDKVDTRASLRILQDLIMQDSYPLEISSLLYLILKDTCDPKEAYSRIREAQAELNATYSREDISKNHFENWPFYIPYLGRPSLLPPNILQSSHPFNFSPSYYHYSSGNGTLPYTPTCRYPYLLPALRSPEFLTCSQPLQYLEERRSRLTFDPIPMTKEERPVSGPNNLCVRENPPRFPNLENKFSSPDGK